MINVQDLDFKSLTRTRRVNGERIIELDIYPTSENIAYFDLVVEEAVLTFDGDEYVIKKLNEKSIGKTYYKQVVAIHKFYVDLINKQQPKIHNGSITFQNYMNMVFEDTPYANFEVVDQFLARSFENLGNDNRVALMSKGLDRFKAEIELIGSGYKPRFKQMIGEDTDTQFRYGHNIKAISKEVDTTNLATKISGTGDPKLGITATYTSPNAAIFGVIDAPPVNDKRFKSESALLEEMKSRLIDSPEVSITVDFVDLRAAGYPYHVPNEGDRIWLIYEPMDDLLIETRILEIKERFDINLNPIQTETTLSNHKKSFAGIMFDNVQKQLSEIVNDDGVVKYSVLDEAVKIATEALHSAQTELEFNNGIIARDKANPNRLVVYNSAGLGISDNGGNTFRTAITGDGIVADVITGGSFGGNVFTGGIFRGSVFEQVGTDGILRVDDDGLKILDLDENLRAAILLGGTQGVENTLGLTLIDDGESVFEINQDGQRATVLSKIALDIESERDVNIIAQDDVFIENNGQIKLENSGGVSRGISLPEDHVITTHASDGSLALYPNRRGVDTRNLLFRIRSHNNRTNYIENLRILNSGHVQLGNEISLGANASSSNRKLRIMYNSIFESIQFITSDEYPMSFRIKSKQLWINWDTYYNGLPISTSKESEKILIEDMSVDPYKLLEMNVFDYYDKRSVEGYADILSKKIDVNDDELPLIRRIPGLSANEAHNLGLNRFVFYDKNNEVEGLMYDRLWITLIPITRDHENRLNEYDQRFGSIETRINKLEREVEKLKGVA